jgi:hypothetical protein
MRGRDYSSTQSSHKLAMSGHAPAALPTEKIPQCLLERQMGEMHGRYRRWVEEETIMSMSGFELPIPRLSTRSLVAIPTKLS